MLGSPARRVLALLVPLATVAAVAAGTRAEATYPGPPTGEHITAQTSTSFTVGMDKASNVTGYRVAASTVESDIYYANINKPAPHKVFRTSATPSILVGGLPYTSAWYYYRVATVNGSTVRWSSAYHSVHLRPYVPTGLTTHVTAAGTYLTWSSAAAVSFDIEQATNSSFTGGEHTYATLDSTHVFTPYNLTRSTTYYFRVRGRNSGVISNWTSPVSMRPVVVMHPFRVVTYNVLSSSFDGDPEGGTTIASWLSREPTVVGLLVESAADLIGVQEAGGTQDTATGRQSSDLAHDLGAHAYTPAPANSVNVQVGLDMYYKSSRLTPIGAGGVWGLGDGVSDTHAAAYQQFRVVGTTQPFLAVDTHLLSTAGSAGDQQRNGETASLLSQAEAYAHDNAITTIMYFGDFNSWPGRYGQTYDYPGIDMRAHSMVETNGAAQVHYNRQYESINQYKRTPPLGGSADRVFVTGGTAVSEWLEKLHLVNGQFVGVIPSDHNPVASDVRVPSA